MPGVAYPPNREASPSPRLSTVHAVARVLKEAAACDEGPLSLAELGRRMPAKRVRHETLRACVDELKTLGFVTEGSKGAMWTLAQPDVLDQSGYVEL